MDHFDYVGGVLHCERVSAAQLAERFGTPLYVYSRKTLLDHFDRTAAAFAPLAPMICFAVKSCHNLAILRLLNERGAAFDVVSGGELRRVLEAGADPTRVVFAGVGKTDEEITAALDAGIGWFNVESEAELENIAAIASRRGAVARVALRVNPDVDPHTHVHTTTGKRETKFGVDLDGAKRVLRRFADHRGVELAAIHLHIGSLVNTVEPYVESVRRGLKLIEELNKDGHKIRAINIGGGFSANYDGARVPAAADYASAIVPLLAGRGLEVLLEPGRSISANAGVLLTRVLYTKQSGNRRFAIVDAAMTDLIRPVLYDAFHFIWPVEAMGDRLPAGRTADVRVPGACPMDVVGPVCESSDFLAKDRWLPPVSRGDLLCVFTAGAYGAVMSSQYNSRPRAAEVLVDGDTPTLIRRRESYDDLVAAERI